MFSDQSILVTGGTGSFGTAFLKHVLAHHNPRRVIALSRDEYKHWRLSCEIPDPRLRCFVGDVRDRSRLALAMRDVQIVVHAAALKRIDLLEYNPTEAIRTNVDGTMNVVLAALEAGVSQVVALSTDKAVSPVNLYGASKLCAEKVIQDANVYSGEDGPRFAVVRYGNVAGSRGSVIPLWRDQIARGVPLSVTDPRMTRYWITMTEAIELVLTALERMQGGEVFVPKIPSFHVTDLAAAMAGKYEITGIRPGEKLHESLIGPDESRDCWDMGDVYVLSRQAVRGRPVQDGFSYTSKDNTQWLTVTDLRHRLQNI